MAPVANECRQQREFEKQQVAKSSSSDWIDCCNRNQRQVRKLVGGFERQKNQHQQPKKTQQQAHKTSNDSCCCCCSYYPEAKVVGKVDSTCNLPTHDCSRPIRKKVNQQPVNSGGKNITQMVRGRKKSSAHGTDSQMREAFKSSSNRLSLEGDEEDPANCAKCQLIARWTLAQAARIQAEAKQREGSPIRKDRERSDATKISPERPKVEHLSSKTTRLSELVRASESCDRRLQRSEEDAGEISSLTESCFSTSHEQARKKPEKDEEASDKWSLMSSGYQVEEESKMTTDTNQDRSRVAAETKADLARIRRPAPRPPTSSSCLENRNENERLTANLQCDSKSNDSGNASGTETGGSSRLEANLLSELEISSIEHFLKSHKSATYVCGCMANLYLTNTRLADNGRFSMPTNWELSKTGVPVLTFDSGLTKNRDKRRLSINLTERGSGFVLWSDIIDHLSNYRAYSSQLHSDSKPSNGAKNNNSDPMKTATCDTFHVMYLSTNHRVMVGLSFDDAKCARLFLKQVELVSSDPTNIALTGPKFAQRIASASRLGRFFSKSTTSQDNRVMLKQRTRSIGSLENSASLMGNSGGFWSSSGCLDELSNQGRRNRKSSRISQLVTQQTATSNQSWSTLKRAIRLTQRQSVVARETSPDEENVVASLRPRPLASLAGAGRTYKASKRLPRKCDISAPCLFQHVTRVDLNGLERLYSRSLVGSGSNLLVVDDKPLEDLASISSLKQVARTTSRNGKQTSISASSCYSSASISPASSEYGTASVKQVQSSLSEQKPAVRHYPMGRLRATPPRVPQRTISAASQLTKQNQQNQEDQQAGIVQNNKIQAIIQELEAQTSSEMVDAKRKLMADIADQVVGRTRSSFSHL